MKLLRILGHFIGCFFALNVHAVEQETARSDHLKRLRGAVSAYALLHDGKSPGKLADLLEENLLDGPSALLRPGSSATPPNRADLESRADYTLDSLAGMSGLVIREREPAPGESQLLGAFKDGSIKLLSAPASNPPVPSSVPLPGPEPVVPAITPTPSPLPITMPSVTPGAAQAALGAGQIQQAKALFTGELQQNPTSIASAIGLGQCCNLLGQLDEAIAAYTLVQKLAPATPNWRTWMTELYLAKRDYAAARKWIDEEVAQNPHSAWAWSWLGSVQMGMGQQAESRRSITQSVSLSQQTAAFRYQNGSMLKQYNQSERAVMEFEIALMLDPRGTGAQYQLGECYLALGKPRIAEQYFNAYLRSDATSEWAARARQHLAALAGAQR